MRRILRTAIVLGASAMALAACGSTSHAATPKPKTVAKTAKYGWVASMTNPVTSLPQLRLPYVGYASPSIDEFATRDYTFYKEIINPADWKYSKTFSQHIFVGPYTSGVGYEHIRDAKIAAMLQRETLKLTALGDTAPPPPVSASGFHYDAYGQNYVSNLVPAYTGYKKFLNGKPFSSISTDLPSEATIVESPVGVVTHTMMKLNASYQTEPGVCVPHPTAMLLNGVDISSLNHDSVPEDRYYVEYGRLDTIAGGQYQPVSACSFGTDA